MKQNKSAWVTATGTAVALVLFAGAYAGLAYAGQRGFGPGRPGGPMGGHGMMMGMIAHELNLTDTQREQIRTIHQQHRDEIAPLGKAVGDARQALTDAATGGADDGVLQQKASDLGTAEAQLALATAKIEALVFRQVLTADQQKKALELRDQMKSRMQQRMHQRQQKQPGGGL